MRHWWGLLLAAAYGCATPVYESYRIEGSTEQLLEAAHQTAHQLGWTTEDAQNGQFRITDFPRRDSGQSLRVRAEDGVLLIDGAARSTAPVEGGFGFRLNEAAEVLARGTDARLHGLEGQPVATRSKAVAVGLDLLLPALGAVYVLRGDPYYDSASVGFMRGYGWQVLVRAEGDVLAAALFSELLALRDQGQFVGPFMMFTPLLIAVLTRVISTIFDWPEVDYRNAYAASGLPNPDSSYQLRVQYSSVGR